MKILVTGAAGFIGSHLCRELVKNHEVIGVDNMSYGYKNNIADKVDFRFCDIRSHKMERNMKGVNVVFHNANLLKNVSAKYPKNDNDITVDGTRFLLNIAERCGVERFVYASSSLAYGEHDGAVTEDSKLNPICYYGISKVGAELVTRMSNLNWTILRYFQGVGPYQSQGEGAALIPITIKRLMNGERAVVYGDGKAERSFTWMGDIIKANIMALESDKMIHETYNITSGVCLNINDVMQILKKVFGNFDIEYRKALDDDVKSIRGANVKIKSLGMEFDKDIEKRIIETAEWYKCL